jgi:hypothetical protein
LDLQLLEGRLAAGLRVKMERRKSLFYSRLSRRSASAAKVPEVISLSVRIGQVRFGHAKDAVSDFFAVRGSVPKLLPVVQTSASDYVVYRCQCQLGMIQMTVQHERIIAG